MLAFALKLRGHEIQIATCDGIFRDCEVLHWDPPSTKRLGCQTCRNTGAQFFKLFGHSPISASSLLNLADGNAADQWLKELDNSDYTQVKYNDYNLGEWSTSSIITCFKAAVTELARPDIRALHHTYLRSSFLVARLFERLIANFKPDKVICFNGRMYPYRVAMEVAARHGIDVLVHERGNSDNRFNFAVNTRTYDSNHVIQFANKWMDTPLKDLEVARVIEHYRAREEGRDSNLPGFHKKKGNPELLRARLNIPESAKITGFFSSSEFELNKFDGFTTKFSQLDTLRAITSAFKSRTDYLIVRHHPFLIGSKENPPNSAFISELIKIADDSPPNVRTIMPQDDINTYDILPHLSGCIAPWSSVAMESAFRGVASAVLPESHLSPAAYRKITDLSPRSISALISELHEATERLDLEVLRKCFRYGYTYIGRMDIEFKTFGISNSYEPVIKISSPEDLMPGKDLALDRIIDSLTLGTELNPAPPVATEEDIKFESKLLSEHREGLKMSKDVANRAPESTHKKVAIVSLTELTESLIYKQRHKNTVIFNTDPAKLANSSTLAAELEEILATANPDFIHIAGQTARYDENFLSAGTAAMGNSQKDGTICGAWLLDDQSRIVGEILSRRFSWEKMSSHPRFQAINQDTALQFLTQVIFTKNGLRKLVEQLKSSETISGGISLAINEKSLELQHGPYVSLISQS